MRPIQEVKECLQTVEKEVHNELCNSIPVYIEEVKAELSVQSPEWCNTGQIFIEKLENEPIVESRGVPPSLKEYDGPDESCRVPPSLKESDETISESYRLTLSPRESREPTEIFKVPHSADNSNRCLSIEMDGNNAKDGGGNMESEGKDRDTCMESESQELATPVESELQEVNNFVFPHQLLYMLQLLLLEDGCYVRVSLASLGSAEVVELFCFKIAKLEECMNYFKIQISRNWKIFVILEDWRKPLFSLLPFAALLASTLLFMLQDGEWQQLAGGQICHLSQHADIINAFLTKSVLATLMTLMVREITRLHHTLYEVFILHKHALLHMHPYAHR